MNPEQLISCALDIGEQMLLSGAEVGRVETTVKLICTAYGCSRTDVFTITSSMVVSIVTSEGVHMTQTRRILSAATDLTRLDRLNSLSREICRTTPEYAYVEERIRQICEEKRFPLYMEALASALIAGAFALFFGGTWADGAVAAGLGLGLRYVTCLLQKAGMNQIFVNAVSSFLLSVCAICLTRYGLGQDVNMIIIGNIMLLIPGIALTNALRDMISGDMMSGMLRLFDAVLVAAAIAAGYITAAQLLGGGL